MGQRDILLGRREVRSADNDESNFKMTEPRAPVSHTIPEPNVHRVLGENPPEEEASATPG